MNVYLAGKIGFNDWRTRLVPSDLLRLALADREDIGPHTWPVRPNAVLNRLPYVGPYYMTVGDECQGNASVGCSGGPQCGVCDGDLFIERGVYGDNTHNAIDRSLLDLPWHSNSRSATPADVVACCLSAIRKADLVFAWVDREDCHGTLIELGYAKALDKMIVVAGPQRIHPLWFVYEVAGWVVDPKEGADPAEVKAPGAVVPAFRCAEELVRVPYLKRLAGRDYQAYLKTSHWQGVRKLALESAGGRCQLCNTMESLQVHHRTYARVGEEPPSDLTVLCNRCHGTFHGRLAGGRR